MAVFPVTGTLFGYTTPPTLNYEDDTGSWLPLPAGAVVTSTGFSFIHPTITAAGSHTVSVRDANAPLVLGKSPAFVVTASPTPTPTPTPSVLTGFFVSPTGSDGNSGTVSGSPFQTIGKAITAMRGGSVKTTYLMGGTYSIGTTIGLNSSDNAVTIAAYPGQVPVLNGNGSVMTLLALSGTNSATLQGIEFRNNLAQGYPGPYHALVSLTNGANSNRIIACHFTNMEQGLQFVGCSNNLVSGCQFDNFLEAGCELKDLSNNNTFDSNIVDGGSQTGTYVGDSAGFFGHGINNNSVTHNVFKNHIGAGVQISNWDGPAPAQIFTLNVGNVVRYNTFLNNCTTGTDIGAMYTLGRAQQDTKMFIEYNYIDGARNLTQANQHCVGIYLDDESNGVTMTGNIVRNVQDNCVQYHNGQNCVAVGNIFDMGSGGCTATLFQGKTYAASTQTMSGNTFHDNIVYSSSGTPTIMKNFGATGFTITHNLYFNTTGASMSNNGDSAPVFGNPLFTNAAGGDYSLQAGSAALGTFGFTPIVQSQIGLSPQTAHWYP